ncbi:MAG: anhydro-N-acetylmuramic acid kinase [Planctomycetota bacterium]
MPNPDPPRVRHVLGCMTGTSLDGLDAVLTRIIGTGLEMTADYIGSATAALPDRLRSALLALAQGQPMPPLEIMRTARHLGVLHAEACRDLIQSYAPERPLDFVVAHGQTVWHAPADRLSWQLFDPWPIVRALGLPVCYDLRQADLIADGEGAPLTPLADWVLYREHADAVINLGGISNHTLLHPDPTQIRGGDGGPCNLLLDGLCQDYFGEPYDRDGRHALRGKPAAKVAAFLHDAIDEIRRSGSLGREQFSAAWLRRIADQCRVWAGPEDVLATAAAVVARYAAGPPSSSEPRRWVVAGGGAHHPLVLENLRILTKTELKRSDDLGIPCEAREAMGFAVLGALSADGVAVSLPQVTGSHQPGVAGSWAYPPPSGATALRPRV